jgi:hypothetical protein
VYGGQRQYLPLRVNHGGVMPIIFAQSLMLFPGVILGWLDNVVNGGKQPVGVVGSIVDFFNQQFVYGHFFYVITEIAMIYFFAYFWTTVQFQPKEMANQLRDYGSFIPGLRPGKRTADYLEKVMMRMTYVGAAFLCAIAVIPTSHQRHDEHPVRHHGVPRRHGLADRRQRRARHGPAHRSQPADAELQRLPQRARSQGQAHQGKAVLKKLSVASCQLPVRRPHWQLSTDN